MTTLRGFSTTLVVDVVATTDPRRTP